jgi:hypothetical protein
MAVTARSWEEAQSDASIDRVNKQAVIVILTIFNDFCVKVWKFAHSIISICAHLAGNEC